MKLLSYRGADGAETGIVAADGTVMSLQAAHVLNPAVPPCLPALLAGTQDQLAAAEVAAAAVASTVHGHRLPRTSELACLPPILRPGKVICIAGNYSEHLAEWDLPNVTRAEVPVPWLFLRPPTALLGSGAPLVIPEPMGDADWELELAVIVGQPGRNLSAEGALQHVTGYTIFNDLYARTLRFPAGRPRPPWDMFFDWYEGRCFDRTAPCGPFLVTANEVPDPQSLEMTLWANGEVRQRSSTAEMLFSVAECLAFASSLMTLEAGDVVATGTCAGSGLSTGQFLRDGDILEAEIGGLGHQRNVVRLEGPGLRKQQ